MVEASKAKELHVSLSACVAHAPSRIIGLLLCQTHPSVKASPTNQYPSHLSVSLLAESFRASVAYTVRSAMPQNVLYCTVPYRNGLGCPSQAKLPLPLPPPSQIMHISQPTP
ncbi:hypothetical protein HZ326_5069 [Fusarium oxysporum f. sp. albedinis]|nr:hypothetical protein HZ326_5069 [Fusarium oxysporum f. sp. albedinis]